MSSTPLSLSSRAIALTALLSIAAMAGCGSDGPTRPEASRDAVLEAPEAHVPDGVADIRSELASQKSSTLEQMDVRRGTGVAPDGAPSGGDWHGPIFDMLDFGASLGHLLW